MVLRGEMTRRRRAERPKSLHNFTFSNLKWGSQRHLKCMKIDSTISGGADHRLRRRSPFRFGEPEHRRAPLESADEGGEEEGIEEFRVKIMSDLKNVRDKITQSIYALKEQHEESPVKEKETEVSPVKPWNLRKRRAPCKEQLPTTEEKTVKQSPSRDGVVKFSVKLTKKEIEEDFMAALGHRPPRRPKKRPRTVQKKLDSLLPGFYLTEVTLDAYKVPEDTKV